jgi:hypothetical protein
VITGIGEAIRALLREAAPGLFGGDAPAVAVAVAAGRWKVELPFAAGDAADPRPEDRVDRLAFDPAAPPAALQLTSHPFPGPRRVALTTEAGDRIPVRPEWVEWDAADERVFRLALPPTLETAGVTGVRVTYVVISRFVVMRAHQRLGVELETDDAARLRSAVALATGIVELNRQALVERAATSEEAGEYGAAAVARSLVLLGGHTPRDGAHRLVYRTEVELRATRTLGEGEGAPIVRIRTPRGAPNAGRPIDIHIDVDA